MKSRLCILICSALFVVSSFAHEGRPIYVEVTQTSEDSYTLQWKIPPVMPDGLEPLIRLEGELCKHSAGDKRRRLAGVSVYQCKADPSVLDVVLSYPAANPVLSVLVMFKPFHKTQRQRFSGPDVTRITLGAKLSFTQVASQYLGAGVSHLLAGYDHLLFVLCLMWISRTWRRLLLTVTGFTVGHSITLALASVGYIWVPVVFIEVLIALSIVILAAEILGNKQTTFAWQYPAGVAALFGLLHGFGFASVLSDLGLPQDMMVIALVFFNIGIELGQLFFVAACWLVFHYVLQRCSAFKVGWMAYNTIVLYLVGTVAAYWVAERYLALL